MEGMLFGRHPLNRRLDVLDNQNFLLFLGLTWGMMKIILKYKNVYNAVIQTDGKFDPHLPV